MANRHVLERPKTREKLLGFIADGMSDAKAAAAISTKTQTVTRQAITSFRHRHAAKVEAKVEEAVAEIHYRWIADKDARLGALEEIYAGLREVKETYGFMVTTEDQDGDGERRIYDQHFNGQLAAQMRGVLSDAADELGQKPRPNVNINTGVQVIVRDYHGFDPE